jgi:hypothetical protein
MSDEGVYIYRAGGGRAQLVENISWQSPGFEQEVAEAIVRKGGGSVLIFNDMVEQHYRKERVPKINSLDKKNVLKRRVSAAFPAYPIRSAIKLKEKAVVADGAGNAGDVYLLAAVPLSESVRKTLSAVQKSYASVSGFCLLPVESASMVHAVSRKLKKNSGRSSVWTIFVGQHRGGSLRQIVTKNGELALTRMTPIIDSDMDQDVWSSDVASELKGTMSYLSRFGFDPSEGLDVIVIANNAAADRLVSKIDFECNLNILTATEAAGILGLKSARQEDQRYADTLHVGWLGKKSSLVMPLDAPQLAQIIRPAQMAAAASIILFAACGYLGYETYVNFTKWSSARQELETAQQQLASVTQEHAAEVAKKNAAGVDFLLMESSVQVFNTLEKRAMKPLPVFDMIGRSLGPDLHLQSLEVKPVAGQDVPENNVESPYVPADKIPQKEYEVVIRLVFPAKLAPEIGVQKVADLEKRLKANLPQHQVSVIKQVADLSYTGNFVGESTNQEKKEEEQKDYEAQIMIRGSLI